MIDASRSGSIDAMPDIMGVGGALIVVHALVIVEVHVAEGLRKPLGISTRLGKIILPLP